MIRYFIAIALFLPLWLNAQNNPGIRFDTTDTWSQIKTKAKEEHKYIFLDLFATWCGPCKMMDLYVYSNDTVGMVTNNKFIAVRVQMDSSAADNVYTRSWYRDAQTIGRQFRPTGYPTFLFFSSDGSLIFKDLGYKDVSAFLQMEQHLVKNSEVDLYRMLDEYKKGKKDTRMLGDLAVFTKSIIRDKVLATQIATQFKSEYLDSASEEQLLAANNVNFVKEFTTLVNSGDRIFDLFYRHPCEVDSVIHVRGWALRVVEQTVTREEIESKVANEGKPTSKHPAWGEIKGEIERKYPALNAADVVADYQLIYYSKVDENWSTWADVQDRKIKRHPIKTSNEFFSLNLPAWTVFLKCNDKKTLKMAMHWVDQGLRLLATDNKQFVSATTVQSLDTKANLLYKLGKIDEAIREEKHAISLSSDIAKQSGDATGPYMDDIKNTLDKMEHLEPTYVSDGALWNHKTLP